MLNLQLPSTLYLGGRPYNQVTAIYHMAITAAAPLSVEEYSVAWGWSVAEAKIFILQVQQNSMLQLQQNASNEDWHNSCSYNINNINYNYNNNTSTSTSTNISTTVVVGIHDKLNLEKDTEIPFASDCDAALRKFFSESTRRSQSARDLLLYWILLYQQAGFQYSELLGKDLGAISGVVMDNNEEKAAAVLDWLLAQSITEHVGYAQRKFSLLLLCFHERNLQPIINSALRPLNKSIKQQQQQLQLLLQGLMLKVIS